MEKYLLIFFLIYFYCKDYYKKIETFISYEFSYPIPFPSNLFAQKLSRKLGLYRFILYCSCFCPKIFNDTITITTRHPCPSHSNNPGHGTNSRLHDLLSQLLFLCLFHGTFTLILKNYPSV